MHAFEEEVESTWKESVHAWKEHADSTQRGPSSDLNQKVSCC